MQRKITCFGKLKTHPKELKALLVELRSHGHAVLAQAMMWASAQDAFKGVNTAETATAPLKASCSEAHIKACASASLH